MEGASLRERRQALLERPELQGDAFCRAYAAEADAWLAELADAATRTDSRHLALIAVGGYGRGELCPFSDLDVVLVHEGRRDIATVADAIWYPVWDQGVRLDHSVRRPAEVLKAASEDLRVALGLLDARLVWGDPQIVDPLVERVISLWRSGLGARWLPDLQEQVTARHHLQGDVAFLLEPDLKESHGGLRDVNVLRALAAYAPTVADYIDLEALGPAAALLTLVRVELHRNAGRALDRLLLQEQDQIAAQLPYRDADALMAAVSEAGRSIAWVSDEAWRRRPFWQPAPVRRFRQVASRRTKARGDNGGPPASDSPLAPSEASAGLVILHGEVGLAPNAPVSTETSLAFLLAAVAAERDLPIAQPALRRLADRMPALPDPWPAGARESLVRVLGAGHPAVDALEALDHYGILVRLLPEWRGVRNKPQRNAYHRYTVDRHLLEAAANAASLTGRVDRPDLLLVGTLLHDIGKGSLGDHTEVGMTMIATMAQRMGFSPDDVATLVDLCRFHLLLPDTATRRDLDDPTTIETVAKSVGDRQTLELLAALTEADSLATGPSAWGPWKAGLVAELVQRTSHYLSGRDLSGRDLSGRDLSGRSVPVDSGSTTPPPRRSEPTAVDPTSSNGSAIGDLGELMAEARRSTHPVVRFDPPHVAVAAPDRPGLLASVAGLLALHGLDVRSADVTSGGGVAAELFTVDAGRRRWPDLPRFTSDLEEVFSGALALDERLDAKASAYAGARRPSAAHPVTPTVDIDDQASATSTVVEIHALDEVGLLHRVTRALFECGLDVVSARVSTVGDAVVDAFYVRDSSGHKLTDPTLVDEVRRAVETAIT